MLRPDRATFVGTGKLEEIKVYVKAEEIDMVVFDDELSPSQLRNIERELQVKILDRSNLILDIFAGRAQTAQAENASRISTTTIFVATINSLMDSLGAPKREVSVCVALVKLKLKAIEG